MLDLQALPSLERFDSQLLHAFDLFKTAGDGANVAALLDAGVDGGPPTSGAGAPQLPDAADAVLQAMFAGSGGDAGSGGGSTKGVSPSSAGLSSQAAALASFSPGALPGLFAGSAPSLPVPPLFGAAAPQEQASVQALQGPASPAPAQRRRGRPSGSGRSRKAGAQPIPKTEPLGDGASGAAAAAMPEVAAVAASSQAQGGSGAKRKRALRPRATSAPQDPAVAGGDEAAMEDVGEWFGGGGDDSDDDYAGDDQDDSLVSSQSPKRRARGPALGPGGIPWCEMSITPGMDEQTRAKIRREKNRVAARKCRAKKMAFMEDLQAMLRTLVRKNEELKMQAITWHRMFAREVRLREAMKRLVAALWRRGAEGGGGSLSYSAHDAIVGLESGTLEVDNLLRTLEAAGRGGPAGSRSAVTNLASAAAGLAPPQVGAPLPPAGGVAASLHQQMVTAFASAAGGEAAGEGNQGGAAAAVPVSGFGAGGGVVSVASLQLAPSLGQLLALHQQQGDAVGTPSDAPPAAAGWPATEQRVMAAAHDWPPASGSTGAAVGGGAAGPPPASDASGDSRAGGELDAKGLAMTVLGGAAGTTPGAQYSPSAAAVQQATATLGRT